MTDEPRIPFEAFEVPMTTTAQVDDVMTTIARGGMSPDQAPKRNPWIYATAFFAVATVVLAVVGAVVGARVAPLVDFRPSIGPSAQSAQSASGAGRAVRLRRVSPETLSEYHQEKVQH